MLSFNPADMGIGVSTQFSTSGIGAAFYGMQIKIHVYNKLRLFCRFELTGSASEASLIMFDVLESSVKL